MRRSLLCAGCLGALFMLTPQPVYAYIDPGLGSLLFQSTVAGFLALGAAWVGFKMKISSFFDRGKDKKALENKTSKE